MSKKVFGIILAAAGAAAFILLAIQAVNDRVVAWNLLLMIACLLLLADGVARAWNAFREGKEPEDVKDGTPERFPVPEFLREGGQKNG